MLFNFHELTVNKAIRILTQVYQSDATASGKKRIQIITYINLPKAMVFFPTSYSDTIPRHIFLCAVSKEHFLVL